MTLPALVLAAAAAASTTAGAADSDSLSRSFDLDEVVITGTLAPKLLKDTPVQSQLITHADIARSDATDIQQLLQLELPAVEFTYAMNQQTHMNLGGFGGQGVLFLVDGERIAGETMDDVDFNRLEMAGINRVEIVRGASGALYGSSSAGGVINLITARPDKPWSVEASARYGSHNQQRYGLSVSAAAKAVSNIFSATYSRIDNYDVHSAPDPDTRVFTTVYGNRVTNFKDRFTVEPLAGLKLSARAGFYFREVPRTADVPERYRDYSAGLRANWNFSNRDNIDASYSFDQYDKSEYNRHSRLDVRNYSNVQNTGRVLYNHTFGSGDILTAGADLRHDYLMNRKIEGDKSETSFDAFLQYDWIINHAWEVVGAVRYDRFSDGNHSRLTPRLTARWHPSRGLNVRMAYGTGFRAPTLKEKYYQFDMAGIWIVNGNPDLKPETSHNLNVSVDWTHLCYNIVLAGYFNHVDDKIATGLPYYLPGDASQLYLNYVNLNGYNVGGAEVTLQARWSNGISAKLSYSYTHEIFAKDKDGNTANNQYIPARKHALTARVEWFHALRKGYDLTVGINGRAFSGVTNREYKDYYNVAAGTIDVRYPAYTLWRLSASQTITDRVKINLGVDNILNYRPRYYYLNAPVTSGTTFTIGATITLD